MKKILILGAGTAGTMTAHHLIRKIDRKNWSITVVDGHKTHYYQPGFLFIPFGLIDSRRVGRPGAALLPRGVEYLNRRVERIDADGSSVQFADGTRLPYHVLVIATGSRIEPGQIEGLDGEGWRRDIFDFYTVEGATALSEKLRTWEGGRLVVHLAEMPVKCPVAPLEFAFLADWFFHSRKMRDKVDLTYVTPLSGAFTKKTTSEVLGHLLADKGIGLVTDFDVASVDPAKRTLRSWEEKEIPYDLLVSIPTNMGDEVIARSGLGDDLRFVPTEKHSLRSKKYENVFVTGDATDLPSSKAGSVAHFQGAVLAGNILNHIAGRPLHDGFDGHANCFIESGFGRAFLLDFNYDTEPMEGTFPLPVLGPFSLLKQTRLNHLGKLAFGWIYWNVLLKGLPIPLVGDRMSMSGKIVR
jgi:sulfide:quinone oxidoreductase